MVCVLPESVGFWQTAEVSFGAHDFSPSRADNDRDTFCIVVTAMLAVSSATCSRPRSCICLHC